MQITRGGFAVVEGDSHFAVWVEESGRLDHDQYVLRRIQPFVASNRNVVDVGANIGTHTTFYEGLVDEHHRVYAFEVNPAAFECLAYNCGRSVNIPLGLSDAPGMAILHVNENVGASYVTDSATDQDVGNLLPLVDLDRFMIPDIGFIKIDVEGFESRVLAGAMRTINLSRPNLWIEVSPGHLARASSTLEELFGQLISLRYAPVIQIGDENQCDMLFTPIEFLDLAIETAATLLDLDSLRLPGRTGDELWDGLWSRFSLPSSPPRISNGASINVESSDTRTSPRQGPGNSEEAHQVIDIVIKSFSRDYANLTPLLMSVRNFLTGYRRLLIVLDDEPELVNLDLQDLPERSEVIVRPVVNEGYIEQQLVKLDVFNLSGADFLLPLDSDSVLFRPTSPAEWLHGGKPVIPCRSWADAERFPPLPLIRNLVQSPGVPVRHDLHFYIRELRANPGLYGVDIDSFDGQELIFRYTGGTYALSTDRAHDVWIAAVMGYETESVDTMRCHYAFSRIGLAAVEDRVREVAGVPLEQAAFDPVAFPVFSEYQLYGNVVRNSVAAGREHVFLSNELADGFLNSLPIVKCNTRQPSAIEVTSALALGSHAHEVSRHQLLDELRKARREVNPLEDWH